MRGEEKASSSTRMSQLSPLAFQTKRSGRLPNATSNNDPSERKDAEEERKEGGREGGREAGREMGLEGMKGGAGQRKKRKQMGREWKNWGGGQERRSGLTRRGEARMGGCVKEGSDENTSRERNGTTTG